MKKGKFEKIERMAIRIKWAFFIFLALALIFVVYSGITMAATGTGTELYSWVSDLRNKVSTLIGALALAMIIVGGIMYATSAGSPAQIKTAKEIVISAISGVVLYILSTVLLGGSATQQGIIGKLFPPPPITNDGSGNKGGSSGGSSSGGEEESPRKRLGPGFGPGTSNP